MTDNDDLPAEVGRQDEEAELKIAAQLAGLGKGTGATHDDDLPAEVRRQDEEAELQIAAQVAGLRTDEASWPPDDGGAILASAPAYCL